MGRTQTVYFMVGLFRDANERPIIRILEVKVRHPLESNMLSFDWTIYTIIGITHLIRLVCNRLDCGAGGRLGLRKVHRCGKAIASDDTMDMLR